MQRFRKKPLVIEAVQWQGTNAHEIIDWLDARGGFDNYGVHLAEDGTSIKTLEGWMTVTPGDWIVRGVKGELYPCKPDIFAASYEPEDPQGQGGPQ